jgi:hypothetical protein
MCILSGTYMYSMVQSDLRDLGNTRGELKVDNVRVDGNKQRRVFDFSSIRHRDDKEFDEKVLEDHSNLATWACYLACFSGYPSCNNMTTVSTCSKKATALSTKQRATSKTGCRRTRQGLSLSQLRRYVKLLETREPAINCAMAAEKNASSSRELFEFAWTGVVKPRL